MPRRSAKHKISLPYMLLYACITGLTVGAVLALFITCSKVVVSAVFGFYKTCNTPLAVVCALTLALLCCFLTAVVQTLCPMSKGSGIPLAEASARGMLRVKWLSSAAALVAGSLLAFACGMPLGSEGPSIGVGGLIGDGIGRASKRPVEFRRYLITGGASAGLAVAFNAPLTGIAFALEETHRRFAPGILVAAATTVVSAVLASQAAFFGLGQIPYLDSIGIHAGFAALHFLTQVPTGTAQYFIMCAVAAGAGLICAAAAVAFNRAIFALLKLFGKIRSATLRLLPAFLLASVCGLCLYLTVGSGEAMLAQVFDNSALWLLFVLLAVRFVLTVTASGSKATGGLFLPMMAIGGLIGMIISRLCPYIGLDGSFAPNIIMICISAFFAASAHAPISAIALSFELTASFTNLLPCAIAVGAALVISLVTRTEPLYEHMMEELYAAAPRPANGKNIVLRGIIGVDSAVREKRIRNVLWPYNSLVTELVRGENRIVPDGETVLRVGDILTIHAENVDPEFFVSQAKEYITIADKCENMPETD